MKITIDSYEDFSHSSFDNIIETIFEFDVEGCKRIKRYRADEKFRKIIEVIKSYAELGKKTALLGNKKKAYRLYVRLSCLMKAKL